MTDMDASDASDPPIGTRPQYVPLNHILLSFLKLGSTSFGGGSVGWINREVVDRRGWISEEKFMQILTVALAMPGANPVNLAVYVGLQLRGYPGAVVAAFGMIAPPFVIILLFSITYSRIASYPHAQAVLGGLACVGLSAMMLTGIKSASRIRKNIPGIAIAAGTFVAVALLRLPMIEVVLVVVPVSVGLCWWQERAKRHG